MGFTVMDPVSVGEARTCAGLAGRFA